MISNFETNGSLAKTSTKYQTTKLAAESLDLNNNERHLKDRNVPIEYKFHFENVTSSCHRNPAKHEHQTSSDQENSEVTAGGLSSSSTNHDSLAIHKPSAVLKALSFNNGLQNLSNHYYSHGNNGAMKRGCEDVENENEDDLITSISSSNSVSRRSPPKKPKFVVTSEEMNEYFNLLHQNEIQHFLKRDACCLISDKYALAMVFTYFKRAKFNLQEYTKDHFYLALYLASDIEEDVDEYKYEIFPWALGSSWRSKFSGFLRRRDALLRRIGYRAIVSRKCCEEVMSFKSEHCAWKRERAEDHGGATRAYLINKSKKFLLSQANLDDEELNLPRLPEEAPRPCPLCLINRGWNSANNCINSVSPTLPLQPSIDNNNNNNNHNNINNQSKIGVKGTQKDSNEVQTSYSKGYSLTKRQKSSNNEYSKQEEITTSNKPKAESVKQTQVKTPKTSVSISKSGRRSSNNKLNNVGAVDDSESNFSENEPDSLEKEFKIPSCNKFLKNKLSTTELENHHREIDNISSSNELPINEYYSFNNRHTSLVSSDKLLIKDYVNTSDGEEEENDDDDEYDNEDDVFSMNAEKNPKLLLKSKQDSLKSCIKLRSGKIISGQSQNQMAKKKANYSLSNVSNYNLRSHSAIERSQKNPNTKLQLVPIE